MRADSAAMIGEVWFVDVGQGDCTIIIDSASRRALLIDCPSSRVEYVRNIFEQNDFVLDSVLVTHWDLDHYGGIGRLAKALGARQVFYNHDTLFASAETPKFGIKTALLHLLDLNGIADLGRADAGTGGAFGNVQWTILAPTHAEITNAYAKQKRNAASAVVLIEVGEIKILVGGDAVASTWERICRLEGIRSDILRWPHHGAVLHGENSSHDISRLVLQTVDPAHVIVSCGSGNKYGHPSRSTVELSRPTARVLCTQVTAGCLGYKDIVDRRSSAAAAILGEYSVTSCAGTIRAYVRADGLTVSPTVEEHSQRIDLWSAPLCRIANG